MAGEPGGTRLIDSQQSMIGGLNTVSDDIALLPNQLRKAANARLTEFGGVTKRGGTQYTHTASLGGSVQNGYTWRRDTGARQLMAVANGTLYTGAYGAFPITYTAQSGTLSNTVAPVFAQFRDGSNDVVYIADGGSINKWDGGALTRISGTTAVNHIVVHNERLWGCGNSTATDSIFYSDYDNGSTLGIGASKGGQIVVRTFADETVVSLASINTSLLIFHRRGISRLTGYGQDDITVAPQGVTADVGLIAPKSVVPVGNVAYFISERGLYRCNESSVQPVSTPEAPDPILPIIRELSSSQFANIRANFNRATRELWISIPTLGIYTFHTILDAWTGPWNGGYIAPYATTSVWDTLDTNGLPIVLKGDEGGWISLCDPPSIYKDNVSASGTGGTPCTMEVQFHRLYCGDEALAKALRWGYLTASLRGATNCSVRWSTDFDTGTGSYTMPLTNFGLWGTGSWGSGSWGAASSKNYRIPMGGTGYYTDVSIVDSSAATPLFSRFQLETFSLGRR